MNLLIAPNNSLLVLTLSVMLMLVGAASYYAPWKQLFASQSRQHLLFSAILALALLWLLQVNVRDTIAFHPLLMTVTAMVFGWSFALLIGAAALLALECYQLAVRSAFYDWDVALGLFDLHTLPVDFCLSVAIPVCWAWCVLWFVDRLSFKNPFTYFWGIGFFGAMISCILIGVSALALFAITGSDAQFETTKDNFIVFCVLTFPEGFLNGVIATILTVMHPDLVKTYRDDWYLKH